MPKVINLTTPTSEYIQRSEILTKYYEDIRQYKVLSREEEKEQFKIYVNGTLEEKAKARSIILSSNQRFVVAIAKRFGTEENILDLINEGNIALIDAFETFDVSKDVKFTTWAVWYIRRGITQYLMKYGGIVRKNNIPKTFHLVNQVTNKFLQEEMRQPTASELVDILKDKYNLSLKTINDVISTRYIYIDEANKEEAETMNNLALYNTYSAQTNGSEVVYEKEHQKHELSKFLRCLSEKERIVIKYTYGIDCDHPHELQEIARKINMTTERIRQLRDKALKKMQAKCQKRRGV